MVDHFERLGLPKRFALDAADLDRAYLARSRATHPDFQSGAADPAGVQALAAGVNDARAVLRDPLRRAEHYLELENAPPAGSTLPDPSFLMELMEARDRLESGDAEAVRADCLARESAEFDALAGLLDATPPRLSEARAAVDRIKTIKSLRREAEARLNNPDA